MPSGSTISSCGGEAPSLLRKDRFATSDLPILTHDRSDPSRRIVADAELGPDMLQRAPQSGIKRAYGEARQRERDVILPDVLMALVSCQRRGASLGRAG
jgi:hypothetical protein